jgi:hypothetical protein
VIELGLSFSLCSAAFIFGIDSLPLDFSISLPFGSSFSFRSRCPGSSCIAV